MYYDAGDQEAFRCIHCQDVTSDTNFCQHGKSVIMGNCLAFAESVELWKNQYDVLSVFMVSISPDNTVFTKLIS